MVICNINLQHTGYPCGVFCCCPCCPCWDDELYLSYLSRNLRNAPPSMLRLLSPKPRSDSSSFWAGRWPYANGSSLPAIVAVDRVYLVDRKEDAGRSTGSTISLQRSYPSCELTNEVLFTGSLRPSPSTVISERKRTRKRKK